MNLSLMAFERLHQRVSGTNISLDLIKVWQAWGNMHYLRFHITSDGRHQ